MAITTLPITADLIGSVDVDGWIYYCVDDLGAWPGLDAKPLREMEVELLENVDAVVTVSEHLQERLKRMGRDSTLITHGFDPLHWEAIGDRGQDSSQVLFWGLVDERLNSDWLYRLVESTEDIEVVLAGPVAAIDQRLERHTRVTCPGAVSYDELPTLAASASVLVMPYRDLAVTRAMQPLKLKEYMATGRPCVVSSLPATAPWSDCLDVACSEDRFVELVHERRVGSLTEHQKRARTRLSGETWESKALQFHVVIESVCTVGDK